MLADGTSFGVLAFHVRLCPPPAAVPPSSCVSASAFAPLPLEYSRKPLGSHLTSAAVGGVLLLLSQLVTAVFVVLAVMRAHDETMLGRIHSACELRAGIVVPAVAALASLLCLVGLLFVNSNTQEASRTTPNTMGVGFGTAMAATAICWEATLFTAMGSHEIAGVRYQRRREAEAAWQRSRRGSRASSTAAVLAAVDRVRAPAAHVVRGATRPRGGVVGYDNPVRSQLV